MNAKEVFQAAFAKVKNPETWCQGAAVQDLNGNAVSEDDPAACRFCSWGALHLVGADPLTIDLIERAFTSDEFGAWRRSLILFNDNHTHAEVVALWEQVGKENGWL